MGIEVVLQDENGETIESLEDPTNILHRVLPSMDDPDFHLLNGVDWYGDTTFNRAQAPRVRLELKLLLNRTKNTSDLDLLRKIDSLAGKVESGPHLYLKLYGD
jgi:hypothetical protein